MSSGLGSSYSTFSSPTMNGANSFQSAATFPPNGALFSWGANGSGQLGVNDVSIHYSPVAVGAAKWQQVGAGSAFACGVQTGGNLFCWGSNATGQLGIGNNTDQYTPVAPLGGGTYSMTVGGNDFACAIRTDRSLWCWGGNSNGQLGIGGTVGQLSPVHVGSSTWTAVTAGEYHACGIQTDGTLWCWGANGQGQIGQGNTTTPYATPTKVGTATTWTSVSAGLVSTCATKSDGTLWCWGDNAHGQLGLGNTTPQLSPTQITGTAWKTVSVGQYHGCALKTDGTLWCWGENSNGEIGIGSTNTPQSSPQQVTQASNWKTVEVGYQHSCATRTDTTAWCWGNNTNGQLGLGNTTQESYPWQVPFKTVQAMASGSQSNSSYAITSQTGIQANLALGKTATDSSDMGGSYVASQAKDGDPINTYWESAHTLPGTPVWLQVDLGTSTSVGRIVLTTPELPTWLSRTETMSIQASDDNLTFTTVVASAAYTFDPATGSLVTISFAPTNHRYWRLNITNTTNASTAGQISEFEIFAS